MITSKAEILMDGTWKFELNDAVLSMVHTWHLAESGPEFRPDPSIGPVGWMEREAESRASWICSMSEDALVDRKELKRLADAHASLASEAFALRPRIGSAEREIYRDFQYAHKEISDGYQKLINLPWPPGFSMLAAEIKDVSPAGGISLEARTEGQLVGRAHLDADRLSDLIAFFGITREYVLREMRALLSDYVATRASPQWHHKMVTIDSIQEESPGSLLFRARFKSVESGEVSAGIVHYDVSTNVTRPVTLPLFIRNKMRTEVHRFLVHKGGTAEQLFDLVSE